jgi:hypothetical protein
MGWIREMAFETTNQATRRQNPTNNIPEQQTSSN